MELARDADLTAWSNDEIFAFLAAAIRAILPARDGRDSPEERAYDALLRLYDTQPARFPPEDEGSHAKDVVGYRRINGPHEELWTSETLLQASRIPVQIGVSVRQWAAWCIRTGRALPRNNDRCAGKQRNWLVIRLGTGARQDVPF